MTEGRVTRLSVVLGTDEAPLLVRWCTWAPPWQQWGHNDSYALCTADGPLLIDPEAPAPETDDLLWRLAGAPPVATLLSTDWHERDAYVLRERFGIPVWAPATGVPDRGGGLEGEPDHLYDDAAVLPGGVRALQIAGTGQADHALSWLAPDGTRVLLTGDLLNGSADPHHPLAAALPRRHPGLYGGASREDLLQRDPDAIRRGLQRLRAEPCDVICGGHGVPVGGQDGILLDGHGGAHDALTGLLSLYWAARLAAGDDVVWAL